MDRDCSYSISSSVMAASAAGSSLYITLSDCRRGAGGEKQGNLAGTMAWPARRAARGPSVARSLFARHAPRCRQTRTACPRPACWPAARCWSPGRCPQSGSPALHRGRAPRSARPGKPRTASTRLLQRAAQLRENVHRHGAERGADARPTAWRTLGAHCATTRMRRAMHWCLGGRRRELSVRRSERPYDAMTFH